MIVYDLKFSKLKKKEINNFQDVVYEIEYTLNTHSEEYPQCKYYSGGRYEFSTDEIQVENFLPFEEVTKEVILGWIMEKEGVTSIENLRFVEYTISNVQGQIDDLESKREVNLSDWNFSNKTIE